MDNLGVSDYELEAWEPVFGCKAIRQVEHWQGDEDYSKNCAHVFELADGKYAVVTESGCSCYSSSDADIQLFPDLNSAVDKFNDWTGPRGL